MLSDLIWKAWYPLITRLSGDQRLNFLNYGYSDEGSTNFLKLVAEDEPDRACIQLYDRVIDGLDLHGRDVLEVSCGHGGGASYIARNLMPRSMHAIDRNSPAIELCRHRHLAQGLRFAVGDAMALDFADGSFDVVINVEASHCYPDPARFFSEVRRVLRPGGHFLYTDFRDIPRPREMLDGQLAASGLELAGKADISTAVLRGMDLNTEYYLGLIQRLVPRILRKPARRFAGVKGSAIYRALQSGETIYLCFHLCKQM